MQTGWIAGAAVLALAVSTAVAPAWGQGAPKMVSANLYGEDVPEGAGVDSDASGDFMGELRIAQGEICYYFEILGLDDVTAAHIHEGKAGKNGPPVVTLITEGADEDEVCVEADAALLRRIDRKPEDFYINVHTTSHPGGAIRGQMMN